MTYYQIEHGFFLPPICHVCARPTSDIEQIDAFGFNWSRKYQVRCCKVCRARKNTTLIGVFVAAALVVPAVVNIREGSVGLGLVFSALAVAMILIGPRALILRAFHRLPYAGAKEWAHRRRKSHPDYRRMWQELNPNHSFALVHEWRPFV
jgi:hypothetical protein